jgi:Type II CAAX prenyl endopeptidase Rce1-like
VKRVLQAVAAALAAGGFSFCGAWVLSTGLQRLFPPEALGPSAAAGVFDGSKPQWVVVWLAAIAGPLYETLLAQAAPLEMTRFLKAPWSIGIALSAVLFGAAHWIGGGIGHAVVTLFMGTVFAAMYIAFRHDGPIAAYGVAALTHATHNTIAVLLVH